MADLILLMPEWTNALWTAGTWGSVWTGVSRSSRCSPSPCLTSPSSFTPCWWRTGRGWRGKSRWSSATFPGSPWAAFNPPQCRWMKNVTKSFIAFSPQASPVMGLAVSALSRGLCRLHDRPAHQDWEGGVRRAGGELWAASTLARLSTDALVQESTVATVCTMEASYQLAVRIWRSVFTIVRWFSSPSGGTKWWRWPICKW